MREGETLWVLCWLDSLPCTVPSTIPRKHLKCCPFTGQVPAGIFIFFTHRYSFFAPHPRQDSAFVQYVTVYKPCSRIPNVSQRPWQETAVAHPSCPGEGKAQVSWWCQGRALTKHPGHLPSVRPFPLSPGCSPINLEQMNVNSPRQRPP